MKTNKTKYQDSLENLYSNAHAWWVGEMSGDEDELIEDHKNIQELIDKVDETCMGYKVEDLIIFANLLNYYQIDAQTLNSSIESVKLGYKICQDDFKKAMQDNLEKVMKNYE